MKLQRKYKHSFRLSETEHTLLIEKIKQSGFDKSSFLRKCLNNAKVHAKFTVEEKGFYRDLVGMSTNLNQLAKHVNGSKDFNSVHNQILNTSFQINNLIEKINKK